MPNHVTNTLTSSRMDLVKPLLVNEEGKVDFNILVPMPEGMQDVVSGSSLSTLTELYGLTSSTYFPVTQDQLIERFRKLQPDDFSNFALALRLHKETGYTDWYNWSVANWGTKWNAYEGEVHDDVITFLTAWSPPEPIMEALRMKLPTDVTLRLEWEDEGGPNGIIEL